MPYVERGLTAAPAQLEAFKAKGLAQAPVVEIQDAPQT